MRVIASHDKWGIYEVAYSSERASKVHICSIRRFLVSLKRSKCLAKLSGSILTRAYSKYVNYCPVMNDSFGLLPILYLRPPKRDTHDQNKFFYIR